MVFTCDICNRNFRLVARCPRCKAKCCIEDLQWHGLSKDVDCVDYESWEVTETTLAETKKDGG